MCHTNGVPSLNLHVQDQLWWMCCWEANKNLVPEKKQAWYTYGNPKWEPLFWFEFRNCFGGLTLKNRGQYVYIMLDVSVTLPATSSLHRENWWETILSLTGFFTVLFPGMAPHIFRPVLGSFQKHQLTRIGESWFKLEVYEYPTPYPYIRFTVNIRFTVKMLGKSEANNAPHR